METLVTMLAGLTGFDDTCVNKCIVTLCTGDYAPCHFDWVYCHV